MDVFLVTLAVTFFMSGVLMFRNIMESYILEKNRDSYGDWIVSSVIGSLDHPYLCDKGKLQSLTGPCTTPDGEPTGQMIGTVSEELLSFGRISFYEGHYPEKDNEAAMSLTALQKLGCSYELGQTIELYRREQNEDGTAEVVKRDYVLCGTVKPFAGLWLNGGTLVYPDILLTEDALQSHSGELRSAWFYRLDPKLADLDTAAFYEGLLNQYTDDTSLCYNRFLYDTALFEDDGNRLVLILMIVLAVFALSYVLSAYTEKRRQGYYRLRLIGCSRGKLNGIILGECGIAVIIPAILGLALSYLAGYLGCLIAAKSVHLRGFFAFDGKVLRLQIAAILLSVLISLMLILLRMRDRRLRPAGAELTPKNIVSLRRALPRLYRKKEADLFDRRRTFSKRLRAASLLFTLVMAGFMLMCGTEISGALSAYRELKTMPDYEIDIQDPEELKLQHNGYVSTDGEFMPAGEDEYSVNTAANPYVGLTDEELLYLKSLPGVKKVKGRTTDSWHLLSWDGIEKRYDFSTLFISNEDGKLFRDVVNRAADRVNVTDDVGILKKIGADNGRIFSDEELDAYLRGERALYLEIPHDHLFDSGFWPEKSEDMPEELKTPHEGDTVRLFSVNCAEGIGIPVLKINLKNNYLSQFYYAGNLKNYDFGYLYTLFISEKTAEILRQIEAPDRQRMENRFEIYFDRTASYEATDHILASFTTAHERSSYRNYAEDNRFRIRNEVLHPLVIFGALFLMTALVYLMVSRNMGELRIRESASSVRKLRHIGLTEHKLKLMLLKAEAKEALPVLYGFIFGSLLLFVRKLLETVKAFRDPSVIDANSVLLNRLTRNPLIISTEWFLFEAGIPLLLVMIAVLYLLTVVLCFKTGMRIYKGEEIL